MRRLSRYPFSSIHVPGVAGRGTPKPPATTATSAVELAIDWAMQVQSAGKPNLRNHMLTHNENAQQLTNHQSQRMQW